MSILQVCKKMNAILTSHQKLRIFELAVLMIIGGVLEMCSVSMILPFMNVVMSPSVMMQNPFVQFLCSVVHLETPRELLVFMAVILASIYILKNLFLLFEFNLQCRFVYGSMQRMQSHILSVFLHRPYVFFLQTSSAEIMRIVIGDTSAAFHLLIRLLYLFTELVVSAMLIVTVFIITPLITVCIAVVMLLLVAIIHRFIKPNLRSAGDAQRQAGVGMNKWLMQAIHGIREIKILGKEDYFQQSFDAYGSMYVRSMRKNQTLGTMPRFFIEAISMSAMFFTVAALIGGGAELVSIVPTLSAVAMAALRLMPSINRMSSALADVAYNEPALDQLIENLIKVEDSEWASEPSAAESQTACVPELTQTISAEGIVYRYPNSDSDVLSGVSINIRQGESVGIVGASGSGKTTAVDIILGLLYPQKGRVCVDGVDIASDIRSWQDQIGYIPQMIFMLDGSIKSNVCFGEKDENISEDAIWQALEEASLADFVRSLPDGIDTQIGERGVRLSGGQRQRIGIARALYRNPKVLIFDEATSALDNETEAEIMDSINRLQGRKTTIIIAHRLTTIEACDHVFRVENGAITQER